MFPALPTGMQSTSGGSSSWSQTSKAPVARLADVVSGYFTFAVLGIALVTLATWLFFAPIPTRKPA